MDIRLFWLIVCVLIILFASIVKICDTIFNIFKMKYVAMSTRDLTTNLNIKDIEKLNDIANQNK